MNCSFDTWNQTIFVVLRSFLLQWWALENTIHCVTALWLYHIWAPEHFRKDLWAICGYIWSEGRMHRLRNDESILPEGSGGIMQSLDSNSSPQHTRHVPSPLSYLLSSPKYFWPSKFEYDKVTLLVKVSYHSCLQIIL